ncbi:MAG: cell envelope integrity protein CreD [Acidobacteriota bacterium]
MNTDEAATQRPTEPPTAPRRSIYAALKLLALGAVALALWIPLLLIQGIVQQRQGRQAEVEREIAASWGGPQSLLGPLLVLRYDCVEEPLRRGRCPGPRQLFVHAETTRWRGDVSAEKRSRSLFDAVVWQAELEAISTFPAVAETVEHDGWTWRLGAAGVAVSVSDEVGLTERARLEREGGAALEMTSRTLPGWPTPALVAALAGDEGGGALAPIVSGFDARVALRLRGTRRLSFLLAPGSLNVALESSWPSPAFDGARLPAEREVEADAFSARWRVRGDGAQERSWWSDDARYFSTTDFGVSLVEPVDGYRLAERSTKYGILFVVLTFATFLLLEIVSKERLHPAQYFLVGAALCVFYLLLLSVSEHTGFGLAYAIAAGATVLLISAYALGISGRRGWAAILCAGLGGLYSFLYVLLQLEDMAFLMGSVGLFVALGSVMWATRRFDWYRFEMGSRQRVV